MPYPNTYEILEPLTYSDCVLYSSQMTDGFLDDEREYKVLSIHSIYARHLSPNPLLAVYDDNGNLVAEDLVGTYNPSLRVHKFGLDLTSWNTTGKYILKLYANDYPTVYTKVVEFTSCLVCDAVSKVGSSVDDTLAGVYANSSTLLQIIAHLEDLKTINKDNMESAETLITSNGRRIRVIH